MIFGSTLCASQTASAGLTWLGNFGGLQSANYYQVGGLQDSDSGEGALYPSFGSAFIPETGFTGDWSISATTGPGFAASLTAEGLGLFRISGQRLFTVTGTEAISITLTQPTGGQVYATLDRYDQFEAIGDLTGTGVVNFNLTSGTYLLYFSGEVNSGAPFSGEFISVVPAPGAFALLGAAGLAGKRRRR